MKVAVANDPLSQSLAGEYLRILMLGTAACSALASAAYIGVDPLSGLLVIGNLLVLACIMSTRRWGFGRPFLLACVACAVISFTIQAEGPYRWSSPLFFFSPVTLLASLGLLILRDLVMILPKLAHRFSLRFVGATFGIFILVLYLVIVPSIAAIIAQLRSSPTSTVIEELSFLEHLRIRSAKLIVFAVFTYAGACIASFLNVVASSVPRGGAIVLRKSACPQCGATIRGIDKLPLFSFLNLAGRCRNCAAVIPLRYWIVEIVGASIFGALFLFELVTGAANIPGFEHHYYYTGIVWIILYTKWPVIGIYFYHAALFSSLMMLALIEFDRLRCPHWFSFLLAALFIIFPLLFPVLQPVSAISHGDTMRISLLPPWAARLTTCLVGGSVGWLMMSLVQRLLRQGRRSKRASACPPLVLAGTLLGIALGWQATVVILPIASLVTLGLRCINTRTWLLARSSATAVLTTVAFLHHPAWKWLAEQW